MRKNIVHLSEIDQLHTETSHKQTVLVGGCFDLLHYGHLLFLQNAKKLGDILIIALESDEFIRNRKKRKPVHTQQQRAEILTALQVVDYVILLPYLKSDKEYFDLVSRVKPHIIAITENDPYKTHKQKQADQIGAKLEVVIPLLEQFSSSSIINYANILGD